MKKKTIKLTKLEKKLGLTLKEKKLGYRLWGGDAEYKEIKS